MEPDALPRDGDGDADDDDDSDNSEEEEWPKITVGVCAMDKKVGRGNGTNPVWSVQPTPAPALAAPPRRCLASPCAKF